MIPIELGPFRFFLILIICIFSIIMIIIEGKLHPPVTRGFLDCGLLAAELVGNIAKLIKSSLFIRLVRRFLIRMYRLGLKLLRGRNE